MRSASRHPPVPSAPAAGHDNNFNFLRLVLASLVLLSHAPELVDGDRRREVLTRLFGAMSCGDVAVAGFFVLSGYLIVQSWQRHPSLADFLRCRALRIYPGFVTASVLSVCLVGALGAADIARYLSQVDWRWLAESALLLLSPNAPPTFVGQYHRVVNGNLWTIGYEFSCYLCAGLLGMCGLLRRPKLFLVFTWLVAAAWLLPLPLIARPLALFTARHLSLAHWRLLVLALLLSHENALFLYLLLMFCAGGCFALFRERIRFAPGWALASAVALIPCMYLGVSAELGLATLGAYAFFTFAFARLPLLAVFKGPTDISYGVYLYGWPVQKLILWSWPGLSPWALFALSLPAAAAAGWVSWRLIERPCLRLKRPRTVPAPAPSPSVVLESAAIAFATPPARG